MIKANYHTHSIYCDGNNSIEEIIQTAIQKNFNIIGFSSHCMYPFAEDWHISPKEVSTYVNEVKTLSKQYKDQITVLCGFEADYIPGITKPDFNLYKQFEIDYLIGSVHYIFTKNGFMSADDSEENVCKGIKKLFNNNAKKAVCEYFYLEREMIKNSNFTILGHPDVFRKENDRLKIFSEKDSWYKKEVKALVKEISKKDIICEINTGAITRKKMNDVYPSSYFLKLLKEKNVPVTISSDAHNALDLDSNFDFALNAIKKAGYSEIAYLEAGNKIKFQKI